MNSNQYLSLNKSPAKASGSPDVTNLFYAGAAALLLILMFAGFQQFYLHGQAFPNRELNPPIRTLLIQHGIAMTLWMLLLLAQPLMLVSGNRRAHMMLGWLGTVLAICIFVLGFKLGIDATRVNPPEMMLWNLPYKQFMVVPICSITIFAGFMAIGILNRRRPQVHRPMILLATLTVIAAAIDRIEAISSLYRQTFWGDIFGPFFASLVIGMILLVVKWVLVGRFDRYLATGWATLTAASAGIMKLATTDVWNSFANFLLSY